MAIDDDVDWLQSRRAGAFRVMGRLADDFEPSQAGASAAAAWERLSEAHPEDNGERGVVVIPERAGRPDPSAAGQFAGIAVIFLVLVALVLTIACTNLANLMLARATGRVREIAIRSALGAGRARVVRQLATESALLGLAGGVAGVIIAIWSAATLRSVVSSWQLELPVRLPLHIDLRVIAFGLVIAVGAGLLAGLLPALRASSGDLGLGLNEGAREASAGRRRQRARSLLVVAQVAVSVVLLVAAGLFVRSLQNARGAHLGFETEDRLLVSFDPSVVGVDPTEGQELYRQLLARTRALPGVIAAGIANAPAFSPRSLMAEILDEEHAALSDEHGVLTPYFSVSAGYLKAEGTRLLRGRDLRDSDTADSSRVALVNEFMAEQLWPGEDPIGKRFFAAPDEDWEVVGVVEQGKYTLVWEDPTPAFFIPVAQEYPDAATLVVHAAGDPLDLVDPLRRAAVGAGAHGASVRRHDDGHSSARRPRADARASGQWPGNGVWAPRHRPGHGGAVWRDRLLGDPAGAGVRGAYCARCSARERAVDGAASGFRAGRDRLRAGCAARHRRGPDGRTAADRGERHRPADLRRRGDVHAGDRRRRELRAGLAGDAGGPAGGAPRRVSQPGP